MRVCRRVSTGVRVAAPGATSWPAACTASASAARLPLAPQPHVGGARGAGPAGHEHREAPGAHPRRHRAERRQRRPEHGRAVCATPRTTAPGRSSAFRKGRASRWPTGSASIRRWSASSVSTRTACSAIVHGCGYDQPSLSHFSSMGFWHTGVPNGGEPLGWLGRLADKTYDPKTRNVIVNLGSSQSLAVRSGGTRRWCSTIRRGSAATAPTSRSRRCRAGPAARHARTPRSISSRRRRRTRPRARTSSARRPPPTARRSTTASAAGSAATSSAWRRSIASGMPTRLLLRHLSGQLVRHARPAGRPPQPAADVHGRRGARLRRGHRTASAGPTMSRS